MTIEQFDQRQDLMEHVVNRMKDGVHYGLIPGTSDKTLFEPGAEYLRAAYNIQWQIDLVDQREDFVNHEYYYRYKAYQILSNGMAGPSWENSAWSKERKFWCRARECGKDCLGDHGPRGMEAQMLPNNVRDRAYKRAFVAMIRNVTGATGLFKMGGMDHRDQGDDLAGGEEHASGNEGDHPWLITCPVHKVDWFQKGKMREPAHKQGQGFCNQSQALREPLSKKLEELTSEWEPKAVKDWLKLHHGGTFSTFSAKQKIDILTQIKTLGVNGVELEPTAQDGNPVDTETGEISDTTAAPAVEAPVEPETEDDGPPPPDEESPPTEEGSEPDWRTDPLRKK